WQELFYLSNFVVSPRIFVCPADAATTRIASDFSNRPEGGFLNFNFRGNAVGLNSRPLSALSGWTNSVHGSQGNLLHYDGHVSQASTEQLRAELGSND